MNQDFPWVPGLGGAPVPAWQGHSPVKFGVRSPGAVEVACFWIAKASETEARGT